MNHALPTKLAACGLAAAFGAFFTFTALAAPAVAPVAEPRNVPTTVHGLTIDDPYRWLEDTSDPRARAWMLGQGEHARGVLDRIDGREAIARRLGELNAAQGDAIRAVLRMPGDRYYYLKRAVGERQFKLYRRQGLDGTEQLLVDPEVAARRTGQPHAINYFKPAWDGVHLAYGMSAGGSEDASLYLLDMRTGQQVGKPVPRVHDTPLHWLPDSRSLTFTQLAALRPGAPETDTYKDARVLWMRPGAAPRPVFGPTVTRGLGLDRLDVAEIITVPGSRWMVARTTDTTVPEGKLFVAPLRELGQARTRWQRVAGEADQVVQVALQGDGLYVMTQAATPRRKVVRVDLNRPSLAQAELVVAQPEREVLQEFTLVPGGLLTQVRQGTTVVLRQHAAGDTAGRTLPAPGAGTADLIANPAADTAQLLYRFGGWTEPGRYYRLDGERSVPVSLGREARPPGLPEIVVNEVLVASHDGVRVPMTVLHRKGLALDGRNPVLLSGYGSYGSTESAHYSAAHMVWIERGGVLAVVNPRGSGVYGDDWHRAGFKATKPNTWKDGIACARWLIAQGYGSARTMGITGGSAGGIFVGRATTEAPELFAAAIYNVGLLDAVRAEESANGATNTSEFGTMKHPAEARALLEMSTYHAIRDDKDYPGVLLVHGMNDPRVDVWQSAKTAARLQAAQAGKPAARPALLRLDTQAGHGVGSTLSQYQAMAVDIQSFLLWQMGKVGLRD